MGLKTVDTLTINPTCCGWIQLLKDFAETKIIGWECNNCFKGEILKTVLENPSTPPNPLLPFLLRPDLTKDNPQLRNLLQMMLMQQHQSQQVAQDESPLNPLLMMSMINMMKKPPTTPDAKLLGAIKRLRPRVLELMEIMDEIDENSKTTENPPK
jgi:hypothetical protein